MSLFQIDLFPDIQDSVGESPFWDAQTESLYWVDIIKKKIRQFNLKRKKISCYQAPDFPTAIARCEGEKDLFIVALAGGVYFFDQKMKTFSFICSPDKTRGNRLNEGKCDPMGRFWVGSMQTNLNSDGSGREMTQHSGAVFSINSDKKILRHTNSEFGITNTMVWSPDRNFFYLGDSLKNVIFSYQYDQMLGVIKNSKILLENYPYGVPDGSAIDDDGCLWNARFGGGRVIRITPKGKIDRVINLPVTNPTSCTFGGSKGKTLYVTSARFSLSPEQLKNKQEGSLMAIEVQVGGQFENKYRLA